MTGTPARAAMAYGQAAQTIPPVRQVVMLYDGAIARLHEARRAIAEGRVEDRFNAVSKASRIVDALHACLDFDHGGEVAPLLDRVYTYVSLRMQRINVANDPAVCDEVIARLGELRDAWRALADGAVSTPGAAWPASPPAPQPSSVAA
jgi:flagellar secretion chaperone FliS